MMLTEEQKKIMVAAQLGYEAYSRYANGKSVITGSELPAWDSLPPAVRNAWFYAANKILEAKNEGGM